ncbi:hypothetical protein [Chryseobacterium arthrosphaerae]|uniref:hypothetical protein n=1 Tax=Chryseobacterium arthrosphaerae TaxID=651561 RepID=UPI001E5EF776|nr:hypothetical protein [Chryseobacterium arthrosphaerae]
MKHFVILTSFLTLLSCRNNGQKLQVSAIYTEPGRITKEVTETGSVHTYSTRKEVTERFDPGIVMISKTKEAITFRIQGNISSGGHTINKVEKLRFEKGEQNGHTIILRYYAEIRKYPGKESAGVNGYNYTKDETYRLPDDVKSIKIELYEDRINDASNTKQKPIAQKIFNLFAKI